LFLAVEVDDQVRAAAFDAAERLRQRLSRAHVDLEARWVPVEYLHITLWFIGEVTDDRAAAIVQAIERPFDLPRFDVLLAGLGAFPSSGLPRVLWLGVREGGVSLAALHGDVALRLRTVGLEPERRAYSAHVTIARVKHASRDAAPAIRRALIETPAEAGHSVVSAVTLFRSRVSSRGSTYEPLLRVPLR
jgi:2'-5' RNA ligase